MPDKEDVWKGYKDAVLGKLTAEGIYGQIGNQKNGTDSWVTGLCPFHNDRHNSFAFNRETLVWCCFSGCGKGSAFDFVMHSSGRNFKDTLLELGDRLGVPRPFDNQPKRPPIREEFVKQWTENLNLNDEVKRYLREKRGLSDATIKKYQIGWDAKRQRNTIPIRDERGNLVNVRLYNAKKNPKIINYTEGKWKYGSPARLYGIDDLVKYKGKQVIICEGEWDRLLLEQEGIKAVTSTHGCSVFRPEWIPYFKSKDVVIVYDCDKEGQAAANNILKAFKGSEITSIKNIVLPLKGDKDDKDITDYFHKRGFTGADLQKMIDETPVYRYEEAEKAEEVVRLDSFTEVEKKELIDKKVECEITVCGETSEAFHAVEEFKVTFCPRLKKGECFDCAEPIKVPRGAQEYIGSCMSTNVQLTMMLRSLCCRYGMKPSIEILKRTTVKEFFCHQKVNRITQTQDKSGEIIQLIDGKQQELMDKKVYYLSSEHPKPGTYKAVGWVKSHPKTQQVTLLIESLEPQEDDYERFRVEDNIEHLRAFKALKFEEIIEDLRENVTRVYERDEILTAVLLTYCSPRWLHFDHRRIRGWIVTAILGDAGSGKTQTYQAIAEHTGIGDIVSGLTSTRTGLAYALVEHKQKGWQVRIGRYPANTRKLLVVDEVQFIPERDLRTMAKAMEEGFFQVDRVQSSGYESQTRLILIGNPRRRAIMEDFSFGCQALETIFDPAVIRRTDIAVFTNYGDIEDLSFINKRYAGNTTPKVTPEMLRAVIYWTWNLRPEQVVFSDEATDVCLKKAEELPERYGYAARVPLVTREDMRNKLARLAAGFAVLDGSSSDDFSKLHIQPEHVHAAALFIEALYSAENCQLDELSDTMKEETQVTDYEDIEKAFLEKQEGEKHNYKGEAGHFTQTIRILRYKDIIRREYLAEQVGCSPETLKPTISLLKKYNLIDSGRDGYKKTPKLNKFLKRFLKNHPDFFKREDS